MSTKSPPDAITLFVVGPTTGLPIAGTFVSGTASSPSAQARDAALTQQAMQMAVLVPSTPATAASRVVLSEPTLQLAHSLPDGENEVERSESNYLPDSAVEALAIPLAAHTPAHLSGTAVFAGESADLLERDSYFADSMAANITSGPVAIADTAEAAEDALSPLAIAGLAMILGGSWRSAPLEQDRRSALRV
jgi:hypothetical protein